MYLIEIIWGMPMFFFFEGGQLEIRDVGDAWTL
jgi:hypothetical protein